MSGKEQVQSWFAKNGWKPFPFQEEVWSAYSRGKSGLLHSSTGSGKTLAVWLGPLIEWIDRADREERSAGIQVLWLTPLRALASDTAQALQHSAQSLQVPWTVGIRTGDTSSSTRAKQKSSAPEALVTTPESLSLMLAQADSEDVLRHVRLVVVDEWHELMSTKRGVQTELALARLRKLSPSLRIWGISATLGNLEEAADTLVGDPAIDPVIVRGEVHKELVIDSLIPENISRFPWAGHFGTQMVPSVIEAIETSQSCLIFTNTRAQSEIWYQTILEERPDWKDSVALHHGSLDREVRDRVEEGIKTGALRAVVCTSSLDLGVDFSPVDRVLQVGSPKGVARLLQRAGRSGHRPGSISRVTCVPTHALELIEFAAARNSAQKGKIEDRPALDRPLDVLTQHVVTVATGIGFRSEELLKEVRTTRSFRALEDEEWEWVLDFVTNGGSSLRAYPEYRKVELDGQGIYRVSNREIAARHRMSIGTIVSDSAIQVQILGGGRLGTVEESFIARLKKGDRFVFAGRPLEFLKVKDMTAFVKRVNSVKGAVPRWAGGRLPLSSELSQAIREQLSRAREGELDSPELLVLNPILELQARWSSIPGDGDVLVERFETRDGHHLFFYPFEGRLVHEGLAALFAFRISRLMPITFTMACNDYGFELLSTEPAPLESAIEHGLLSTDNLSADIVESLNSIELAKRQFREIARVAGLVFQGFPGAGKSVKQLQASSGLFYDVFARYEPTNKLFEQSHQEVLERQLEQSRLVGALERISTSRLILEEPGRPTPLAFPVLVDRLRETLSSESLSARIERMTLRLEKESG